MIRHIVMLSFKDRLAQDNQRLAEKAKQRLEGLKEVIPGIIELKVYCDALPSSNRDVIIDSLFETPEALAAYQVHPAHVEVASFVTTFLHDRACIDYHE